MCRAHLRAHTQEGKFKCASCGYCFRHKHHLQRHEKNMHGLTKTLCSRTNTQHAYTNITSSNTLDANSSNVAHPINITVAEEGNIYNPKNISISYLSYDSAIHSDVLKSFKSV